MFNWIKALLLSAATWTETEHEQMQREREGSTGDSQKLNKVWALFEGKKVAEGVWNVAKLVTLCSSISPTTCRVTCQTENTRCINRALKKCAHTSLSLSPRLLSFCTAHTSLSLSLSLSASEQFLFSMLQRRAELNSVKNPYLLLASLILHASIAKITAELLSLSYGYFI